MQQVVANDSHNAKNKSKIDRAEATRGGNVGETQFHLRTYSRDLHPLIGSYVRQKWMPD